MGEDDFSLCLSLLGLISGSVCVRCHWRALTLTGSHYSEAGHGSANPYSLKLGIVVYICDSSPETVESWWLFQIPVRLSQKNKMKQTNSNSEMLQLGCSSAGLAWLQGDKSCTARAESLEVRGETNLWASHALRRIFTSVSVWVASEHESKAQSFCIDDNVNQNTAFKTLLIIPFPNRADSVSFAFLINLIFFFKSPLRLVEQEHAFSLFSSFSRPRLLEKSYYKPSSV